MKRRNFLKSAAVAAASLSIVPRHVLGGNGNVPPSERLNLASIGVGGQGGGDIGSLANGPINMVGLCDVQEGNLAKAAERFPAAKTFTDFRKLFDALDKQIDAVSVSTPDHMHVPISMSAIRRGKHVYCQKPLAHSLYEARQIAAAAKKARVVTQMGIQIHSNIEYRMATQTHSGRSDRPHQGGPFLVGPARAGPKAASDRKAAARCRRNCNGTFGWAWRPSGRSWPGPMRLLSGVAFSISAAGR